jgi:gluconolactonase
MDSSGKHLGTILSGGKHVTNVCFGGDDWKTLFITTFGEMGKMQVKIPGLPVPRGEV